LNPLRLLISSQPISPSFEHLLLYGLIGIALLTLVAYLLQDRFIFKPEKLSRDFQFKYDVPFRELFFDVAPGVSINGLHFYRESPSGLIFYLHGNSRSIKGWAKYAKDFYRYNYDVVLVDYRGFGKSTGKRSEKELISDLQFVYNRLCRQCREDHLIVYAEVLAVALQQNWPQPIIRDT